MVVVPYISARKNRIAPHCETEITGSVVGCWSPLLPS